MKEYIGSSLVALRDFYNIVNTREKAVLLVVLWALLATTYLVHSLGNVEAIERLMITYTKCVLELKTHQDVRLKNSLKQSVQITELIRG